MSRSDMIVSHKVVGLNVSRRTTFVILLVPAIALFLLADVSQAVTLASRVFAAYFTLQATIAWIIARRKGNWAAVAGFTGIGVMMATIAVSSASPYSPTSLTMRGTTRIASELSGGRLEH